MRYSSVIAGKAHVTSEGEGFPISRVRPGGGRAENLGEKVSDVRRVAPPTYERGPTGAATTVRSPL